MTEQLLHVAHVGATLEQVRRARVAQRVGVDLGDAGGLRVTPQQEAQ